VLCTTAAMAFDHILGQRTAIETLTRALRHGLVHHAYRFEGLDGIGKEKAALALAQALLCTADDVLGCGRCDACRRVVERNEGPPASPLHPDVVYVARAFYPPDLIGGKKEASEISVEQIRRVVLSRANYSPHEGRAQVFIVRGAEELSLSAANALLKTLEEPRPATHFILLTSRSDKLIDTIRSRSLPIRFGPLPDDVIARILRDSDAPEGRIAELVQMAGGSASAALHAADPELSTARADFVSELLAAVDAPDLAAGVRVGEGLDGDRRQVASDLRALAGAFAQRARTAVVARTGQAEIEARRHALVHDAIDCIERNGSPSLAISSLVASLRHAYLRRPGNKPHIVIARR
jgi:DNA polymerase-3 subunit delta'